MRDKPTSHWISTPVTVHGERDNRSFPHYTYIVPLPVAHIHTGQLYQWRPSATGWSERVGNNQFPFSFAINVIWYNLIKKKNDDCADLKQNPATTFFGKAGKKSSQGYLKARNR